jgi:hypothetical protein
LKRGSKVPDAAGARPSKRKRFTPINEDDMDWLKGEIADIKEGIREIAEHLEIEVDCNL